MTVSEVKALLPTMVTWMAKEAVMEGVKAYHKAQKQYEIENQKKQAGESYNFTLAHAYYEGVGIASEVMWKLFASCSAECRKAIDEVAKHRDGYCGYHEEYFDDFILALEKIQGHTVRIRIAE